MPDECAFHGVEYQLIVNGQNTVPSYITLVPNGIKIETNDPDDADDYELELLVKPNGPSQVDDVPVVYDLVISACKLDTITISGPPIQDFTYYVGSGPSEPKGGNFVYSLRCGIDCTLSVDYTGTYDPAIYTFDEENCLVTVDGDDSSLHDTTSVLELTGTAPESADSYKQVFEITFIDECHNVLLTAPEFAQSTA